MQVNTLPVNGTEDVVPFLTQLFIHLLQQLDKGAGKDDFMRIVLQSAQLESLIFYV